MSNLCNKEFEGLMGNTYRCSNDAGHSGCCTAWVNRETGETHGWPAATGSGEPLEYRKIATIRAVQWFKVGDHQNVTSPPPHCTAKSDMRCDKCGNASGVHGWIKTLEGGSDGAQLVCPGDWIATGSKGENWPIKPDIFAATYVRNVPTPPASQPTVTLDRETFDNVVSKLKIVERCTPDREGKDLVLDALALLRAAEQK